MSEHKHSPLPYRREGLYLFDRDRVHLAQFYDFFPSWETRDYIVDACNNYERVVRERDALRTALKAVQAELEPLYWDRIPMSPTDAEALSDNIVKPALEAKGES